VGFWWRGSCCRWRWWWGVRNNQANHRSRQQWFWVLTK
jgi:hypothetical protein